MKISINDKDSFIKRFLIPISKLSESAVIKRDKTNPKVISALVNTPERTTILYATYTCATDMEPFQWDVRDVGKLSQCITCIDSPSIELEQPMQPAPNEAHPENFIKYTSPDVKFKYHLLEPGVAAVPKVNLDKIRSQKFEVSFNITSAAVANMIKAGVFTNETNKIYFYSRDGKVHVELTDKMKDNTDSFGRIISTELVGDLSEPVPVGFDIFRLVSGNKYAESIRALINPQHKVFLFDVSDETCKLNYIASGFKG